MSLIKVSVLRAKFEVITASMRRHRLQWFGYVCRTEREIDNRMVTEMRVQGKRKRGPPQQRYYNTENMRPKRRRYK